MEAKTKSGSFFYQKLCRGLDPPSPVFCQAPPKTTTFIFWPVTPNQGASNIEMVEIPLSNRQGKKASWLQ